MRQRFLMLFIGLATAVSGGAQEPPRTPPIVIAPGDASECILEVARGDYERALSVCRAVVRSGATEPKILDALAHAELERGEAARAVELWQGLLDQHGWQWGWALGLAKGLWRQDRTVEAEAVLRDAVRRGPAPEPARELVGFLLSFSRWQDASAAARAALATFPADCSLHEALAVAEAGQGHDGMATTEIRKALKLGCPPLRWTRRGEVPHRIDRPEYRSLLDAKLLAKGLASLPEGEALYRLRLLELVPDPGVAPQVADPILHSQSAPVRLAGLHLLLRMGKAALPQWPKVLAAPDLMLRKHALRMLVRSDEPWLLPLLEQRLKEEPAPGNLSLVRIAAAKRIAATNPQRARTLLKAVPDDDPSATLARELLDQLSGGQPPSEK